MAEPVVRRIDGPGIIPELTAHCDAYPAIDDHVNAVKIHEMPIGKGGFPIKADPSIFIYDLGERYPSYRPKATHRIAKGQDGPGMHVSRLGSVTRARYSRGSTRLAELTES